MSSLFFFSPICAFSDTGAQKIAILKHDLMASDKGIQETNQRSKQPSVLSQIDVQVLVPYLTSVKKPLELFLRSLSIWILAIFTDDIVVAAVMRYLCDVKQCLHKSVVPPFSRLSQWGSGRKGKNTTAKWSFSQ
ncbi:UNVERIFIED_CONTAM: hypothetical protein K2H54_055604 [Gekko kuhli]